MGQHGQPTFGSLSMPTGECRAATSISTSASEAQADPAVAQRVGGGAAVVVWEETVRAQRHPLRHRLERRRRRRRADHSGRQQSRQTRDVATLADGRSLVVAHQPTPSFDIVFRFIDAAGTARRCPGLHRQRRRRLNSIRRLPPSATMRWWFTRTTLPAIARYPGAVLRRHQLRGGGDHRRHDGRSATTPDVAALTDGRFMVVWEDDESDDIHGRFVSATGVPLGTRLRRRGCRRRQ